MTLKLLEQISLPGDPAKANEDSFATLDHAALVLDGATPLGPSLLPGPSDAAWIAQFGARRLAAHLKDGDAPEAALAYALQDTAKSFAGLQRAPVREKWQLPCASLIMAVESGGAAEENIDQALARTGSSWPGISPPARQSRRRGEMFSEGLSRGRQRGAEIEFFWFGDCAALIEQNDKVEIVGDAIPKRQAEAKRAKQTASGKNLPSALGTHRPEILPALRAARNRINSGKNWLFSPDARAAGHVSRQTVAAEEGARLLVASDGFLALISDYQAYDAPGLMRAISRKGLAALGEELRAIEKSDPSGERFFRFKPSDDATALLLQQI